jgi:hypothetical protein
LDEYDASDPQDVAEKRRDWKARQNLFDHSLRNILRSSEGRIFLYDMLSQCHIFQNPFSADLAKMAFACGEMNIGQWLLAHITRLNPEMYMKMLEEENDRTYYKPRPNKSADTADSTLYPDNAEPT